MVDLISEETAIVWRGGGRRYFTKRAAAKAAALEIVKDHFRCAGEDPHETDATYLMKQVRKLADLIRLGRPWSFDFERPEWVEGADTGGKG
mgnify:CR=1 FL=1